jgi:rRNA maturation protein Nop10
VEEKDKEKKPPFLKVDYNYKDEYKELRKLCKHGEVEVLDIDLVDGNLKGQKSTLISEICPVCGKSFIEEVGVSRYSPDEMWEEDEDEGHKGNGRS